MYKQKKILAIIPARAGSKRIKNKNIISFKGKPMIVQTLDVAKNVNVLTKLLSALKKFFDINYNVFLI